LDPQRKQALQRQLQRMADSGASFSELEAKLGGQDLSGDDYDELWVFAWALVRPRAPAISADKDASYEQEPE
jgi:hypothetical protein